MRFDSLRFLASLVLLIVIVASCGRNNQSANVSVSEKSRDNIYLIQNNLRPFVDDSVEIHNGALIGIVGRYLVVEDTKADNGIFKLLDPADGSLVNEVGKRGEGPQEITVPGVMTVDSDNNRIYMIDYGQWKLKYYDIDSMVNRDDYYGAVSLRLDTAGDNSSFPDRYVHISDTLGYGRMIRPRERSGFDQSLCRFNPVSGKTEPFGVQENAPRYRSSVAVSQKDRLVAELSSTNDLIRIYDFDGQLKGEVFGPGYVEQPSGDITYFNKAIFINDNIYAIYSGDEKYFGKDIIVMTKEGRYMKTLRCDDRITDIAYDPAHDNLYLCTDGDAQIVYMPLSECGIE